MKSSGEVVEIDVESSLGAAVERSIAFWSKHIFSICIEDTAADQRTEAFAPGGIISLMPALCVVVVLLCVDESFELTVHF